MLKSLGGSPCNAATIAAASSLALLQRLVEALLIASHYSNGYCGCRLSSPSIYHCHLADDREIHMAFSTEVARVLAWWALLFLPPLRWRIVETSPSIIIAHTGIGRPLYLSSLLRTSHEYTLLLLCYSLPKRKLIHSYPKDLPNHRTTIKQGQKCKLKEKGLLDAMEAKS
jgi:hypothetical protein